MVTGAETLDMFKAPLFLEHMMYIVNVKGQFEKINQYEEYKTQYGQIGLYFCEPHDMTSRIWGSIVNSLTQKYQEGDQKVFTCVLVPMLGK